MIEYAWLIPVFPVIGFLLILFLGKRMKEGGCGYTAILFAGLSLLVSLGVIAEVLSGKTGGSAGVYWINFHGFQFGTFIDHLSALMLFVVSFVSFLIVVYSLGYMHGEEGFQRYYAEISLFIASMLSLVISNNLLLTFISWELVGLCSYLLIGFWYKKPTAASAAKKAFLVTRVGDFAFLLGILVLYAYFGTLDYQELFEQAPAMAAVGTGILGMSVLTLSSLLLFGGAVGKSAQFPLHVWLPDAMEGPTTVSALIHAATMVKAGIFLVARTYPLFTPESLLIVAYIGGITALIAAAMALVMTDVKRIIAYSTISSLGYMTLALGVGGFAAGLFYLLTHSFFKALLFLAAGSVIHAAHTQDIRELGGLLKKMPITGYTALIGAWALSGFPPLSGFWSKDEILIATFSRDPILFAMGMLAAFLTAVFSFRWFFTIFTGEMSEHSSHAHESPPTMTVPLVILAVGAALAGFVKYLGFEEWISEALPHGAPQVAGEHGIVMELSILLAALGIFLAYYIYHRKAISSDVFVRTFRPLHTFVVNKYYMDHLYLAFAERVYGGFAYLLERFDMLVIDGIVNGIGRASLRIGEGLRKVQSGVVQDYASVVLLGVAALLILLQLIGGRGI
jgi:NADH-quinone oxidoreductase subunit L